MAGQEQRDRGALSSDQQETLRQVKIKTRIDNENYLRSHPEIDKLMSDFLREVFLKRPSDIREFAAAEVMDGGLLWGNYRVLKMEHPECVLEKQEHK